MCAVFPVFKWRKVLIIDDNPIDSLACERLIKLSYLGEEVICVNSTSKAMAFLLKETSKNSFPDIIFLNVNSPGAGSQDFLNDYHYSFAQTVSSKSKIVLVTAAGKENERQHEAIHKVLNKPFSLKDIEEIE